MFWGMDFHRFSLIFNDRRFWKLVENVERLAPRMRETRATPVFLCWEAPWSRLEFAEEDYIRIRKRRF